MANTLFTATEEDQRILMEMAKDYKKRKATNTELGLVTDKTDDPAIADIFLVKAPSPGGIPAFSSGSGTPGSATCDVYKPGGVDGTEAPVEAGFTVLALNYTGSAVTAGDFRPVSKEKLKGKHVINSGEGGSTDVCADLKAYTNEGDMPTTGVKLVTIEGTDCKLRDWDICEVLQGLTERTFNTDVLMVGVDKETDPDECGLYPLGDIYDALCAIVAILRVLAAGQEGDDLCP